MKADVRWENAARTVIRFTYSGPWDWADFYAPFSGQHACAPGSTTCALIDLRTASHIPSDAILHLRRAAQIAENVGGLVIIIATSASAATTFRLFVSMYRSVSEKFRLAGSDAEAFAILQMPQESE